VSVCAFTSVCEEDSCWVGKYLTESYRLELPFAVHLDRCSAGTKRRFYKHHLCVGITENKNPSREFTEQHKQGVFDLVLRRGFDWAFAWDVDETYERDAAEKINVALGRPEDLLTVRWVNLWGDEEHVRTDGPFRESRRAKFYRLKTIRWKFDNPVVNGAYADRPSTLGHTDLHCLHWGLMTEELRRLHKERWDRIYGRAVGANPYGMWNYTLDTSVTPTIEENVWR
jgi:hypothetical protein